MMKFIQNIRYFKNKTTLNELKENHHFKKNHDIHSDPANQMD